MRLRPLKLNVGLRSSLLSLALVALLWLPTIPSTTTAIPKAAEILRADGVVSRCIKQEPTLVLYDQYTSFGVPFGVPYGFSVVMGVLADSNNHDLVRPMSMAAGITPSHTRSMTGLFMIQTVGRR